MTDDVWDSSDISSNSTQMVLEFSELYGLVSHLALPSFHYQVPCLWRRHLKLRCYHHLLLKLISVSLRNIDSLTSYV